MRRTPPITISEIPGDQYKDLESAQRAAFSLLAENLGSVIRDLLARGVLVICEGKIMPNPERRKTE